MVLQPTVRELQALIDQFKAKQQAEFEEFCRGLLAPGGALVREVEKQVQHTATAVKEQRAAVKELSDMQEHMREQITKLGQECAALRASMGELIERQRQAVEGVATEGGAMQRAAERMGCAAWERAASPRTDGPSGRTCARTERLYMRRRLKISGMDERLEGQELAEAIEDAVMKYCVWEGAPVIIQVTELARLGSRKEGVVRGVAFTVATEQQAHEVLRAKVGFKECKEARVFVDEHLLPEEYELFKQLYPRLKEARQQGKRAFFRRARLFVGEKGQEVEWEVERKSNRAQAANWAEVGYDVVMGEFGLA